jgi:hypothetical protein
MKEDQVHPLPLNMGLSRPRAQGGHVQEQHWLRKRWRWSFKLVYSLAAK